MNGMGEEAVMMVMSCPAFTGGRSCTKRAPGNDPEVRVAVQQLLSLFGLASPVEKALQMGGPNGQASINPWDAR
jgi:hypothetical protein